jgi:hypothetical protein
VHLWDLHKWKNQNQIHRFEIHFHFDYQNYKLESHFHSDSQNCKFENHFHSDYPNCKLENPNQIDSLSLSLNYIQELELEHKSEP